MYGHTWEKNCIKNYNNNNIVLQDQTFNTVTSSNRSESLFLDYDITIVIFPTIFSSDQKNFSRIIIM